MFLLVILAVPGLPVILLTLGELNATTKTGHTGWDKFVSATPKERSDGYAFPFICLMWSGACVAGAMTIFISLSEDARYHNALALYKKQYEKVQELKAKLSQLKQEKQLDLASDPADAPLAWVQETTKKE